MKALIDTCVIVDALQARKPFDEDAKKIFLLIANQEVDGCISAKSITDIYYLSHQITHNNEESRKIIGKLFDLFEIVDTTGMDCRRAIPSDISDYEDAIMVETAARINADCIITRNERDYAKSTVRIMTPKVFLDYVEKNT